MNRNKKTGSVVLGVLEGKNVNLRVVEKEDLPLLSERDNNPEVACWKKQARASRNNSEVGLGLNFNSRTQC
jgi:hypothetical protein